MKRESKPLTPTAQLRDYIARLAPQTQQLFRSVRTAVRKRFPSANELVYDYGQALVIGYAPGNRGIDAVLALRADDKGVFLYFSQGPQLPDPQHLLRGSGKQVRFIQLESAKQLAIPDVAALIAAAVEQAKLPLPSRGKGTLIIKTDRSQKAPPSKRAT